MFVGSLVALVTPMHINGDIDFVTLERLVDFHLQQHTSGLVILGTTGESPTITGKERKEIITRVITQVKEAIPVIVGTGTNCTSHTIELTNQAMELGADGALVVTPYYNKPTQEGLYQHFRAVAEAVPLPLILYNVPSRTGCDLLPETISRLDHCTNIVAVKESSGDLSRVQKLIDLHCHMSLLTGNDDNVMDFIFAGGKGVISVVANVAPQWMAALCSAALAGSRNEAQEIDNKFKELYKVLFLESNPIPVKWALTAMKMIEPGIRLPLTTFDQKFHERVRGALRNLEIRV